MLIVVPPFASIDRQSLAAHLLQACARDAGHSVNVLYANLAYAAHIGEDLYEEIADGGAQELVGERIFAAAAFGRTPAFDGCSSCRSEIIATLKRLQRGARSWVRRFVAVHIARRFDVVGCTTTFEQTASSIAMLDAVKRTHPDAVTIVGGGNCEGDMAEGIARLSDSLDYVFSGESESSFVRFLSQVTAGAVPGGRVLRGAPVNRMDDLPTPDYREFFEQRDSFLPRSRLASDRNAWITYESSRGCWWGQKHHCTFCGLNDATIHFRAKSPERVVEELRSLLSSCNVKNVCMTDNIMSMEYFRRLLPRLAAELPGVHIFYEQKANLSLDKVQLLGRAGVKVIQPGIEALDSELLRLMDKGITAAQNIALLRYCRAVGVSTNWNLLFAFPGDSLAPYARTLSLIPLLVHLDPPSGLCPLSIDRFSPYHDSPGRYGIRNVRPVDGYALTFPRGADLNRIAYHFTATYPSASRRVPAVIRQLNSAVEEWKESWTRGKAPPFLGVTQLDDDAYSVIDTRPCRVGPVVRFVNAKRAAAMLGRSDGSEAEWAIANRFAVRLDGHVVPLALADPELIAQFQNLRSAFPRGAAPDFRDEKVQGRAF